MSLNKYRSVSVTSFYFMNILKWNMQIDHFNLILKKQHNTIFLLWYKNFAIVCDRFRTIYQSNSGQMSTRRAQSMPPAIYEKPTRGRCLSAICVSWKVFTCVLSHVLLVALVVAYCWMGAITFEHLEAGHEREVGMFAKFWTQLIS